MSPRIVIVGAGIAGLATAWYLDRAGCPDVLVLEGDERPGLHSTGKNAAILRSWCPDPVICALGARGAEFLRRPPRALSLEPFVEPCGLVLTGRRGHAAIAADFALVDGVPPLHRELDEREFARRAPHFRSVRELGDEHAHFFPHEGRIDLALLVAAFTRALGPRIVCGQRVTALVNERGAVRGVRCADGTMHAADAVLLATGGWGQDLAAAAGSRLTLQPTRRHLLVAEVQGLAVPPDAPIVWSDGARFYARPQDGGLLMCAGDQADCDPQALASDPREREHCLERARTALAGDPRLLVRDFWCGMRTFSADGRFLVGPDPDVADLHWCAALGGHGITVAGAIGELAAHRLLGGGVTDALSAALDPARTSLLRN